jgi:hypothetical protein
VEGLALMSTQPLTPIEVEARDEIWVRLDGHEWAKSNYDGTARAVVAAVRPAIEEPYARAVAKLATALDQLGGRILVRVMPRRWLHAGPKYGMEFDEPHLMADPDRGWDSWSWWPSWTDLYALDGWATEPSFVDEHSRAFWLVRSELETSR